MKAILVTGHYFESKRKAGFHHIANSLADTGWDVVFWTTCLSWLSVIRRDVRLNYPIRREANRLKPVSQKLSSYVWFTYWHPVSARSQWVDRLSGVLFRRYGSLTLGAIEPEVATADLLIFDSMPSLLLFHTCRRLNPKARFIYRVSDDIRLLCHHPVVVDRELEWATEFDLVSTPCQYIHQRFAHLPNSALQFHGIDKTAFDRDSISPYDRTEGPHIVFAGNSHFDHDFLDRASRLCPAATFHIVGPIGGLPRRANVRRYGEMPFSQVVPFIKHADVGLQCRSWSPGSESLTDSLKMMQYSYCRLPIVAPVFLRHGRPHAFYYEPENDESIAAAIASALAYDRSSINTREIDSWPEVTNHMLCKVGLAEPHTRAQPTDHRP